MQIGARGLLSVTDIQHWTACAMSTPCMGLAPWIAILPHKDGPMSLGACFAWPLFLTMQVLPGNTTVSMPSARTNTRTATDVSSSTGSTARAQGPVIAIAGTRGEVQSMSLASPGAQSVLSLDEELVYQVRHTHRHTHTQTHTHTRAQLILPRPSETAHHATLSARRMRRLCAHGVCMLYNLL